MKLVFASTNVHKLTEINDLIGTSFFQILTLKDLNCYEEIQETGHSMEENALIKARYVSNKYGINVFAEDSGLEIEALDKKPGIYSARFAGPERNSDKNIALVLTLMENTIRRQAQFRSSIALILNRREYLFEGILSGSISSSPRGTLGFGYDPIFIPLNKGKTLAEISIGEKNKLSHRCKSFSKLAAFLNENRNLQVLENSFYK